MALQYPIRLTSAVLGGVDAVQLRRDATAPVDSYARALANLRPVISDPAAVVEFGAQALSLARSTFASSTEATQDAPESDADGSGVPPRRASDSEALLASAFGPGETDAALIRTLDANARSALLPTPGAFDPYSGLFDERRAGVLESGFFRSPNAPVSESPFPGLLDGGRESSFPRAAANDTRESAFPLESAFPRGFQSPIDSTFPQVPRGNDLELRSAEANTRASERVSERAVSTDGAGDARRAELPADDRRVQEQRELLARAIEDRRLRADELEQRSADEARELERQERFEQAADRFDEAQARLAAEQARELERRDRAEQATERYEEARDRIAAEAERRERRERSEQDAERYAEARDRDAGDAEQRQRRDREEREADARDRSSVSAQRLTEQARAQLAAERYAEARELYRGE